jgi:hypothetical protein
MKYTNPNKPVSHADEPVVQDSLTSFDHLPKEKAALNTNMHRHKRNQVHNSPTNRTRFSKPNYRRNQFSKPKHQYRQIFFPSKNFRSGRYRRIPKPRTTAKNTDTRGSQINPTCKVKPFQSKSELQLGETESWKAYLQFVNRTLDQFGTLF